MNREKSTAFMTHMTGIMNGGAMALMCSIGHKTGLFDTMAGMDPATSDQIAEAAGLQERYVREWLSALAAGGVVEHDAGTGTFVLPPEHSGLLTRAAGPLNLTTYCQYVSLLGQVEDDVVDAFKQGGGVPYDRYPQFQSIMAESSFQRLAKGLLTQVVPLIDGADERLTHDVHHLHHALHDRLPGLRRRGPRHGVGRTVGDREADQHRVHRHPGDGHQGGSQQSLFDLEKAVSRLAR